MKKLISFASIVSLLFMFLLSGNSYADSLDTIDVQISKTTVNPGETVKVNIAFGKELGAYTFDVAYDNNIFEYVSVEGGTANATNDKVRVAYYDATGGSNPRSNMSVTFKAKEGITTSNPTEFSVTAEGLANADASISYDDITTPIVKNITVEPKYVDYELKLEYTGDIIKNQEKEMKISYSSPMGRYYEHARLVAEATTPQGASVKLTGKDSSNLEHDIIQSGWGDAQGYKIGGKDVLQTLNVAGVFTEDGNYTITLKLIDRDNSDSVIASKTFDFAVGEKQNIVPEEVPKEEIPPKTEEHKQQKPTKLPKTGNNIYLVGIATLGILTSAYVYNNKKR